MKVRILLASVVAASAAMAGCQAETSGTAVRAPQSFSEPDFPTSRPTRPRATTPVPPATPTARPAPSPDTGKPPGAGVLTPQDGYVFIETKSGLTRCQLDSREVGCESQFANPPTIEGIPATGVRLSADGQLEWVVGNLGAIPATTLDYRTYTAVGWTIEAGSDGTRFTNDRTGRGMFVSVERVEAF